MTLQCVRLMIKYLDSATSDLTEAHEYKSQNDIYTVQLLRLALLAFSQQRKCEKVVCDGLHFIDIVFLCIHVYKVKD